MIIAVSFQYRIVSGDSYKDFDTPEEAIKFMKKRFLIFGYASINQVYTYQRKEDENKKENRNM